MREGMWVVREMEGRIDEKVRVSKRLLGPCWCGILETGGVNYTRAGSPKWLA